MQPSFSPGDVLQVRGRSWILQSVTPHADCTELELEPAEADCGLDGPGDGRVVLLAPFDRPAKRIVKNVPRVVSRRAWIAGLRQAVLLQRDVGALIAPVHATIDLLPHQLEPAMAVVSHGATRLLLADAVGLGKTIEAGLVLAELRARGNLERGLVLTPPGLRDQWAAELANRFAMDAEVADAAWLRAVRTRLPACVNPWSVPGILVASFDFAKRAEMQRSIEQVPWDAVVIDEAHLAAGDSDRRAAAHAIASRARLVLLLTATPHSGDPRSFHSLCRIGSLADDDGIAIFRRTRVDAGLDRTRRVHLHHVRGAPAERAVRRRLEDYIRRVWTRKVGPEGRDARLAMVVLLKRSFSGMAPLCQSLTARLRRLDDSTAPMATQLPLAWDDEPDGADEAPSDVLGAAGLEDVAEERALLSALIDLTRAADPHDSKRHAFRRLLRRTREPIIVFTEYRDTLASLESGLGEEAALLHGGMDRAERTSVLHRFDSGGVRVLLATDAAGEGLNLQHRCRLVVNLELPWNPMRLEQRIGRVDRIGQTRAVHAINLIADATAESDLLARLVRRLGRARAAIGPIDDVLGLRDDDVVACQLRLDPDAPAMEPGRQPNPAARVPVPVPLIDLQSEARVLAAHLEQLRRLRRASCRAHREGGERARSRSREGVLVTAVRRFRLPVPLQRTGLVAIFRVHTAGPFSHRAAHALAAVFAEGPCPRMRRARELRARASTFINDGFMACAERHLRGARTDHETDCAASLDGAAAIETGAGSNRPAAIPFDRDAHLADRARARRPIQRGLFDARAGREAEEQGACAPGSERSAATQPGDTSQFGGEAGERAPRLELLLFITS